jgi:hypothetical protein
MHNMAIENGAERHWSEALQLTEQVSTVQEQVGRGSPRHFGIDVIA